MSNLRKRQSQAKGAVRPDERGAGMVEFVLALPILLIFIGGIIDLGFAMVTRFNFQQEAGVATRSITSSSYLDDPICFTGDSFDPVQPTVETAAIACHMRTHIDPPGDVLVAVTYADGFVPGEDPVILCLQYPLESLTGMFGDALGGWSKIRFSARLERDRDIQRYFDPAPANTDWSFCTT